MRCTAAVVMTWRDLLETTRVFSMLVDRMPNSNREEEEETKRMFDEEGVYGERRSKRGSFADKCRVALFRDRVANLRVENGLSTRCPDHVARGRWHDTVWMK